jgi:heat shock protein HspQ
MSPGTYSANIYFDAIVRIPYTGGTGGSYDGTPKEGGTSATNNLYIERIGGKLNYGGGDVMYRISGYPSASSPQIATFPISFLGIDCSISVGSGTTSLNTRSLKEKLIVESNFVTGQESLADSLSFGGIVITEAGSYAFSLRLYGHISTNKTARNPFYIFLQKNNKSTVLDAAEIDLVTVEMPNLGAYTDYSYSVTLGGVYEVGDKVIISMQRAPGGPSWELRSPPANYPLSPVRTSLIYWKL